MGPRMKLPSEEISRLASLSARKQITDGTHPWIGPEHNRKLIAEGKNKLVGGEIQRKAAKKQLAAGIHILQKRKDGTSLTSDRVENGTHPWLGGEVQRKSNLRRVANGTHPFLGGKIVRKQIDDGTHPFVKPWKCEHCGKEGKGTGLYNRWHGTNCKTLSQ